MKQFRGKILYNKELFRCGKASYFLIHIHAPGIAIGCQPGQFFMLQCSDDLVLRRPISIHDVKEPDVVSMLIAVPIEMGDGPAPKKGVKLICRMREGDPLDLIGPLGNGFNISPDSRHVLIVAGGIGIAPLKYLAKTALASENVLPC